MNKFSWNTFLIKITSRKFIALVCALVSNILIAANVDENTVVQVTSIITAFLSVIAYMVCESSIDVARENNIEEPSVIEIEEEVE